MATLRRPTIWLGSAALLATLYALLHTLGRPWTPAHEPLAQGVVVAMQGVHFPVGSVTRSYWDFYRGFGWAVSVLLALQAAILWQLVGAARAGGAWRAMAVSVAVGCLLLAGVAQRFIFAVPLWMAVAIAACLAGALLCPRTP